MTWTMNGNTFPTDLTQLKLFKIAGDGTEPDTSASSEDGEITAQLTYKTGSPKCGVDKCTINIEEGKITGTGYYYFLATFGADKVTAKFQVTPTPTTPTVVVDPATYSLPASGPIGVNFKYTFIELKYH